MAKSKKEFTAQLVYEWLSSHTGYLKVSPEKVSTVLNQKKGIHAPIGLVKSVQTELRKQVSTRMPIARKASEEVINVGVIGDLHMPFTRPEYLEFCVSTFKKYKVNQIVLIGDCIDNHFSSFHETIPDGKSAGDELDLAIKGLEPWIKTFPTAKVCIGNHDAIIHRKAIASGISRRWIKDYNDVLGAKNWDFDIEHEICGVIYTHGTNSSGNQAALNRALNLRQSVVQGHIHTAAGVQFNASKKDLLFGLQVGCGVDDKSYAMAYASNNIKKSILGCGVVLENGTLPIFVPMNLS